MKLTKTRHIVKYEESKAISSKKKAANDYADNNNFASATALHIGFDAGYERALIDLGIKEKAPKR